MASALDPGRVAYLDAHDGTRLAVRTWSPSSPRAVVQVAHGMAEHSGRYDALAQALLAADIAVVASDHRGHGLTAQADGARAGLGHVADAGGWDLAVADLEAVLDHALSTWAGAPVVLLGHSWGSFLARLLAAGRGADLAGLILMGTGGDPGALGRVGAAAAGALAAVRGASTPSPALDRALFGGYNRRFAPARTGFDWLSRDEAEVDAYMADPACGFICSTAFYRDLARGSRRAASRAVYDAVPADLPILVVSGGEDPVGGSGRAVAEVATAYRRAGVRDVTDRLYPGARHELLHETNRAEVMADLLTWLTAHV